MMLGSLLHAKTSKQSEKRENFTHFTPDKLGLGPCDLLFTLWQTLQQFPSHFPFRCPLENERKHSFVFPTPAEVGSKSDVISRQE